MKIGVTGHQDLSMVPSEQDLKSAIEKILLNYSVDVAYSSLAIGADQIFARACRELNIQYCAVIPSHDYKKNFKGLDLENYIHLLGNAISVEVLPYEHSSEKAFYDAGKYISDHADIIIAVWDGKQARGLGGTGDIVNYSIKNGTEVIQIFPDTLQVKGLGNSG